MKPSLIISAGTCGLARGADEIVKVAQEYRHERGLEKDVEIKITGCHGFCEAEPNVIVQLNGKKIFYQKLRPSHVKDIIERTILKGEVITELLCSEPTTDIKYE